MVDRRRVSTFLSTRLFNPLVKAATNAGLVVPGIAILETTGRNSGRPRRTPVTRSLDGDTCWIVAEHGRKAGYVRNIQADPSVRIKLGRRGAPEPRTSCRATTHERACARCRRRRAGVRLMARIYAPCESTSTAMCDQQARPSSVLGTRRVRAFVTVGSTVPTGLPAGPSEPPILQTLRWLLRPISFLESCRRSFGDAFSVRFLGFQTPLVMLSDPEAIRALYGNRAHGLPPGRTIALQPIVGPRSLLLLEGGDHLARRRLMLPPFHGERMRAYESTVRDVVARDVRRWPQNEPFAIHPRMQRVTLEVILRAVFGVTDEQRRSRLADRLSRLLAETASVGLQFAVLLSRRFSAPDPRPVCSGCGRRSTRCSTRRSPSAAPIPARTSSRCS